VRTGPPPFALGRKYDRYRRFQRQLLTFSGTDTTIAKELHSAVDIEVGQLIVQATTYADREREETDEILAEADRVHDQLSVASLTAFAIGLGLAATCLGVLVSYQRRIERQADDSRHQALHDGLTGLPNRTLFAERTDQALRAADRSGSTVGLLLLDLDRFKEVNDTLGHDQGDRLLRDVARRLSACLRGADTVARLGGDEFAILIPAIGGLLDVEDVARRVLVALDVPIELDGVIVDIQASIGMVAYPDHGRDATELLQRADVAMYSAKAMHSGLVTYDPALDGHTPQRLALLGELRRGLECGELVLFYQPKMNLQTKRIEGVEALVRWQHPEYGLLPPGDFIPLAERTGLIQPLTRYVLGAALRQSHASAVT
jgi:diguanylate cyclase (GGDEF)-like protein